MASIMPKTGFRKLIAVASDSGMKAAAANIRVTPPQPRPRAQKVEVQGRAHDGEPRWRPAKDDMAMNAKRNRPWLICSGCSAGPSASVPSALARSVHPAMKAAAARVRSAAAPGFWTGGVIACPVAGGREKLKRHIGARRKHFARGAEPAMSARMIERRTNIRSRRRRTCA